MSWKNFWKERVSKSKMDIEIISLQEGAPDWDGQEDTEGRTYFGHKSGGFHRFVMIRVQLALREVKTWCQGIIQEKESGYVGLIRSKSSDGKWLCLLSLKQEPGNKHLPGLLAFNAPASFSQANLEGKHGGKVPPFADFFLNREDVYWHKVTQDGGRFLEKCVAYAVVDVDRKEFTDIPDNCIWATLEDIKEMLDYRDQDVRRGGLISSHLMETLGIALLS